MERTQKVLENGKSLFLPIIDGIMSNIRVDLWRTCKVDYRGYDFGTIMSTMKLWGDLWHHWKPIVFVMGPTLSKKVFCHFLWFKKYHFFLVNTIDRANLIFRSGINQKMIFYSITILLHEQKLMLMQKNASTLYSFS